MSTYREISAPGLEQAVNESTMAILVDIGQGNITAPATLTLEGSVAVGSGNVSAVTTPGTSPLSLARVVPGNSSANLAALSAAAPVGTKRLTVWAPSGGVTMNLGANATANSVQVPTAPLTLDCSQAAAGQLTFLGNNAAPLDLIFQG